MNHPHNHFYVFCERHLPGIVWASIICHTLTTLTILLPPDSVQAAETPARNVPAVTPSRKTYHIAASSLETVLNHFGREAGILLTFSPDTTAGLQSTGLQGSYTLQEGLDRLLAGSNLYAVRDTNGKYSLHKLSKASAAEGNATILPEITVAADSGQTGGLPQPYVGGQVARGGRLGILGNRDIMDTPFNQTSYTAELIQNQQVHHVADILNNDPTAHANGSTSTGADDFSIRGFYVGNTDLLFNGMAGATPSFFNSMMAESIERVEILKGPNALLNGVTPNGSVGGVINMIPKRAGNQPLTQFTASYISDSQFGGHVDIGRRYGSDKQFGVRLNGVYRNGNTPINYQSRESALAAIGLDYRGKRLRLSTDFGYQYQNLQGIRDYTTVAAGVPIPKAPGTRNNYDGPYDFSNPEVLYGTFRGEYDLTSYLTGFIAVGGSERSTRYISTNRTIIDALGNLMAGSSGVGLSADKMYAWTLETGLQGHFTTGVVKHQTTLVYTTLDREWRRISVPAPLAYPTSNIYHPTFGPKPDSSLQPGPDNARKMQDLTLSSIALADTLSILDERVQLTLGARLQKIDSTGFNRNTGAITSSYKEDKITPMVGLVVKPWQQVSLYANYIQGLQQGPTAPLTAANAGEVFAPFVTQQYEVGTKIDFGRIATTLALYQVAQPSGIIDPATNVFGVHGEQRHRGVDFNVFGEVIRGVRLLGGAAYIDSELTRTQNGINDGNRGPAVPKWRLVLGAEWDTPFFTGFTLFGRVTHNGPMYLNAGNTQKIPDWTRLDMGARYMFERSNGKLITLRANINNVLGKNYWDANAFGQLTLSDPRVFLVSATVDF